MTISQTKGRNIKAWRETDGTVIIAERDNECGKWIEYRIALSPAEVDRLYANFGTIASARPPQ